MPLKQGFGLHTEDKEAMPEEPLRLVRELGLFLILRREELLSDAVSVSLSSLYKNITENVRVGSLQSRGTLKNNKQF